MSQAAWDRLKRLEGEDQRFLLSAACRKANIRGEEVDIGDRNIEDLMHDSLRTPTSPMDVLDAVLLYIAEACPTFNSDAPVMRTDYPLFGLRSRDDLEGTLDVAHGFGFLSELERDMSDTDTVVRLSASGWKRVHELNEKKPNSRQAFVAMSFASELRSAYVEGIQPALRETGYLPLRIDEVPHNEKIDDRIVAELRRSGLVVADFTGHRGGVYFEAGYALGRGIPVVWCCRENEIESAHFDTRQFNHLTWATPEELRVKLRNRISATLATYAPIL